MLPHPPVPLSACPPSGRVAQRADACGVLPRGLRPRLPMSAEIKRTGPGCRRTTYLWTWKATRPPHGLMPVRWGQRSSTPGRSQSIPTLRVARTPARAGARASGAPIQVHRGKSDMDAAGWLPTAEGA